MKRILKQRNHFARKKKRRSCLLRLSRACPEIIGKYTRQRDTDVLGKFYDDLIPDLPRMPYVEDASTRATLAAMQIQGPPLPKVDPNALYDNGLLKTLDTEGFLEKIKPR